MPHIAIASGDPEQRSELARCLMPYYGVLGYQSVSQAMVGCLAHPPLLALVGENLPCSGGFEFVQSLRLDGTLATVPVMMVVAKDDKLTRDVVAQCGADGVVVPPFSPGPLVASISRLINQGIERKWKALLPTQRQALTNTLDVYNGLATVIAEGKPIPYQEISDACKPLVEVVQNNDFKGMLHGVRHHDNYTYAHSMRVATYLTLFGSCLGLPRDEQLLLASGGLLHDVGKISIPHAVLNKPSRLTGAERAVMQGHVTASIAYMERCNDMPKGILTIAAQHHEKIDGSGYPFGLEGRKLNRLARMASIIDVFTALTDRRVYKPSIEPETALNIMISEMASQLDVRLLGLFRQMLLDAARD